MGLGDVVGRQAVGRLLPLERTIWLGQSVHTPKNPTRLLQSDEIGTEQAYAVQMEPVARLP